MSVSRPARCVASSLTKTKPSQCRAFSSTPITPERRRSRFASVKAADMGLVSNVPTTQILKKYTPEDQKALKKKYTEDQMRVIQAGEEAIDLEDIRSHGVLRNDPYRLQYLDDLSQIRPVLDHKPKVASTIPPNARWMDEEERINHVNEWMSSLTERKAANGEVNENGEVEISALEFRQFVEENRSMTGGGNPGTDAFAPKLPKIKELEGAFKTSKNTNPKDPTGRYDDVIKKTGMSLDEIMSLNVKVLETHRVVNQTRLGKIQSQYTLAIAGNGNGLLGIGEAKSMEMEDANFKAQTMAIKNMKPIPRYENRTIFGDVEGKCGAVRVELMARPPGMCRYLPLFSTVSNICRIRPSLPTQHIRDGPRSRYRRSRCPRPTRSQQDERHQGDLQGSYRPAHSRRGRAWTG